MDTSSSNVQQVRKWNPFKWLHISMHECHRETMKLFRSPFVFGWKTVTEEYFMIDEHKLLGAIQYLHSHARLFYIILALKNINICRAPKPIVFQKNKKNINQLSCINICTQKIRIICDCSKPKVISDSLKHFICI